MIEHQSNVIHQLSKFQSTSKAFYRFYQNKRVCISDMVGTISTPLIDLSSSRHVLVLGDSTEISLKKRVSDIRDSARLGVLSDNKTRGFHAHVHMVMDADQGYGLGLSDVLLWNRAKVAGDRPKTDKDRSISQRSWDEKESYKWYAGLQHSLEVLPDAKKITYVYDAEADMEELWKYVLSEESRVEALIRLSHNRALVQDSEASPSTEKIRSHLDQGPTMGIYELELRALTRKNYSKNMEQNRTARTAKMEVKYRKITPKVFAQSPRTLYAVEAKESPETVPDGESPVHWILLTTHEVNSYEMARQILFWYSCRWMIEQLFRLIKRQGMGVEETELEYVDSILKQTVASFAAVFQVMQLLLAREKEETQDTQAVFSSKQVQCLKALNHRYEGKTQKQKNPYPPEKLSWATWIIGRLGGWKGYRKARPAGPIILKRGLKRFYDIFEGWNILYSEEDMGGP